MNHSVKYSGAWCFDSWVHTKGPMRSSSKHWYLSFTSTFFLQNQHHHHPSHGLLVKTSSFLFLLSSTLTSSTPPVTLPLSAPFPHPSLSSSVMGGRWVGWRDLGGPCRHVSLHLLVIIAGLKWIWTCAERVEERGPSCSRHPLLKGGGEETAIEEETESLLLWLHPAGSGAPRLCWKSFKVLQDSPGLFSFSWIVCLFRN